MNILTLDEYQEAAARSMNFEHVFDPRLNWVMGLMGESGELVDIFKKIYCHRDGAAQYEDHIKKELGDVLWYAAAMATQMGLKLEYALEVYKNHMGEMHIPRQIPIPAHYAAQITAQAVRLYVIVYNANEFKSPISNMQVLLSLGKIVNESKGLSAVLNYGFENVMTLNIEKLMKRHPQGFERGYDSKAE